MKLQIIKDDPLGILASTKPVVEQAHFVLIHDDKLESLAKSVTERFNKGLDGQELGFESTGNLIDDIQLIFIEDAVNFCFWPDDRQPKWEVEWPDQNTIAGGWYGLVACFKIGTEIAGLDKLTAYADYKLPQVLRAFGILEYEKSLADRIDDLIEIPHDSAEEIEIRSATIWAIELLQQKIGRLTAGEIDNTIWLMSQNMQDESGPYHRTRTIFY
jgi:hypothetical protein